MDILLLMNDIERFYTIMGVAFLYMFFRKNHDKKLIKTRNINNQVRKYLFDWQLINIDRMEKGWHRWAYAIAFLFGVSISFAFFGLSWKALLAALMFGFLYTAGDVILNKLMGWDTYHLGDEFWDKILPFWLRFTLLALSITIFHIILIRS